MKRPNSGQVLLKYQPGGRTLQAFHDDPSEHRLIIGPLGSGKTSSAIVECLRWSSDIPPMHDGVRRSRGLVVRNSLVDLKSTTIKDWESIVPDRIGRMNRQPPITCRLNHRLQDGTQVDAEVMFIGYDQFGDIRKIRGLQLTWAWIDEAKELPGDVVDYILSRTGRYPRRRDLRDYRSGSVLTSNAPALDEWLADRALNPPEGWGVHIQPGAVYRRDNRWHVNPEAENLENLKRGYYESNLVGKSEDWIRANLANEFVFLADGRPVHPDYSQRMHMVDYEFDPVPGVPIRLGVDWGRTPALVAVQSLPQGYRVIDEFVTDNMSVFRFSEEAMRYLSRRYDGFDFTSGWGDPAGTSYTQTRDESCFDVMNARGFNIAPAPSNDLDLRVSAVDRVLTRVSGGEPAILVSARCRVLNKGLSGAYRFRRLSTSGGARFADKPEKGPESHVCEALQYLLMGEGEAGEMLSNTAMREEYMRIESQYGGWRPDPRFFE